MANQSTPLDLFIFAGEPSGDLHGQELIAALLKKRPDLTIAGVAGPKMRQLIAYSPVKMEEFQVMGFLDVFMALPKLIRLFYQVGKTILEKSPKAVLLIDYPGFNLRMAKYLRKKGYAGKIYHYICPSVWAYGKGRIKTMAKTLDLLLSIFPFEKSYFSKTPLDVAYVGHPLVKRVEEHTATHLFPGKKVISLFPGSRPKEILRNFPLQLKVAKKFQPTYICAVSLAAPHLLPLIEKILKEEDLNYPIIPPEKTYDLMFSSELAIAKSGTVTLELALHQIPTAVTYALSSLDLFIARYLLRLNLPHYCIVNILLQKEVFPELMGKNFTEEGLYESVQKLLADGSCKEELQKLKTLLKENDAAATAAERICP